MEEERLLMAALYNGEFTDPGTGFQYLRCRYYNSRTGSFLTEDSYGGSIQEPLSQQPQSGQDGLAADHSQQHERYSGRDGAEGHHGPELYQQQALHSQQRRRAEALRQCGLAVQGKRSFGGWGPKGNQPGRHGYLEPVHVRKPHREAVPGAGEEVRAGDREYGDGDNGEGYQRTGTEEGAGADLGVSV